MNNLNLFAIISCLGLLGIMTVLITYASWFDPNRIEEQKCYGSECKNPYLSNQIIGADFSHKYVVLTLANGTQIITDCLTDRWDLTQNSTSWWCGNAIHTIQYVRNT